MAAITAVYTTKAKISATDASRTEGGICASTITACAAPKKARTGIRSNTPRTSSISQLSQRVWVSFSAAWRRSRRNSRRTT